MKYLAFFLFIYLSTASFDLTVGYLERSGYNEDKVKCQLIKDYTRDEFGNKTNGEINLKIDCQEHDDQVATIKSKLQSYYDDGVSLVYAFCNDSILTEEIETFLGEKDMLIWCFNYYQIGKCTKNYIMGNALVHIIETMAYIISTRGIEGVGFIGDNRTIDEFYQVRVIKASYYFGQSEIGSYCQKTLTEDILNAYIKKIVDFKGKVVTYWSSQNYDMYDKFLELKDTAKLSNDDYPVILLDGAFAGPPIFGLTKNNTGNYHMRGYDSTFDNVENEKYKNYTNGRAINTIIAYDEVYSLGIMNMLIYGLQQLQTSKIFDLISVLYKREIPYAGGNLILLDNHYIVATHFAFEFQTPPTAPILKYTIEPILTFEPDQIMGQNVNTSCNFTLNIDTGKSDYNSIVLMFIQHVDGERNVENRYLRSFLLYLIDKVNSAGGIKGTPVKQLFLNIDKDIEDVADDIKKKIELYNCHTGLLVCSSLERQQLSELLKDEDFQFIYLSGNEGNECEKNIIYANPIVANYLECLMGYLETTNEKDLAIISSGDLYGKNTQEILLKKLDENDFDTENISGSLIVNTDSTSIDYIIDTVVSNLGDDGGIIVVTASQTFQIPLFRRLVEKGIVNNTNYQIISLLMNEALAEPIGIEKLENVTYLAHYYYDHTNRNSGGSSSNNLIDSFYDYMIVQLNVTSFPFFNSIGILIDVFNLWSQVLAIRSYIKPSQYLSYIYHYPLSNPVLGPYEIYYSGEALTLIRVLKIVNGQSELVYEDSFSRIENTFSNGSLICNWKKYPNGIANYDFYYVGALFDHHTENGKARLENIQLAIDLINQDGGINDKDLVILNLNYNGDIDTIAEVYEEAVLAHSNILCFIGTDSLAERKAVYEMTKKYEVLIFVISLSQGEFSYSTIIQMNSVTNQILDLPLFWAYDYFGKIGIVYENSSVGNHRSEYLLKLADFLGKTIEFSYPTDFNNSIANFTEFLFEEELKYEKLVVIVLIDTSELLEEFAESYTDTVGGNRTYYPLFIMDYSTSSYTEEYFESYYGAMLYNQQSENAKNVELKNKILQFKGSTDLMRSEFIFTYDTFLFLKEAVPKSADLTATNLRNQLYLLDIDCPDGDKKITETNFITTHISFVQYNGSNVFLPAVTTDMPLMPRPYNFLYNDLKYYSVSYAAGSNQKLEETDPIKIAFFLELTGGGFVKYVMALASIERMNYNGGVNGHEIVSEVYQCPKLEKDASSMIITLYGRGFKVFIGGCNQETREAMQPTIEALDLLFIYTGFNEGQDCSRNTVYLYVSPSQDIIPYMLHLLQKEPLKEFAFIYSNLERYKTRITMLKSVFSAFNVTIAHAGQLLVNETESSLRIQITGQCRMIERLLPNGGIIIVMLTGTYPEIFFEEFYNYFNYLGDSNDIAKVYSIYVIENTHRKWEAKYAAGHYMYSADMLDINDNLNIEFKDFYVKITGGMLPAYADLLVYDATRWVLELFSELNDYHDTEEMLKTMYDFSVASVMGNIKVDSGNHVAQTVFFGRINNDGETELIEYVSRDWRGETYRTELNRESYILCDWKNRQVDASSEPFVRVGIVISSEREYLAQSVLFYQAVYAANVFSNERGGINGVSVNIYVISSSNDPEIAYRRLRDSSLYFNMFIYLGGFKTDIREGLHRAAVETDSLLFYPTDYEANECHQNGFYGGIGYPTYYTLVPTIMKLSPGTVIILYSDTIHSNYYAEELKYDLNTFNIIPKIYLQFPLENKDMSETVEYIQRLSPDGALIVSILEGTSKSSLLQSLHNSGLSNKFITLNLNMDDLDIYNLGEAGVGTYYYDTFLEDNSNELYQNMKSTFLSLFAYIPIISRSIARGFVLNRMMLESASIAGVNFRGIKDALYENEANTIVGPLHFNLNNRFSLPLIFKRGIKKTNTDDDGNILSYEYSYEIVEQTSFSIPQRAYGNVLKDNELVKECDLKNGEVITEVPTKKVVLVYATSGIYKSTHENGLLGAITALRELYDSDKILNHRFLVKFINYDSDDVKLASTLNEIKDDKDIVAYVGCTTSACKNVVKNIAVETNKLFYYPRLTAGEECDYYTFYTSMVANQYITRLMEFLLTSNFNNDYYILTEEDTASDNLVTMIRGEASGLINEMGYFVYNETNQITYDLFEDIQAKMSDGGIIISTFVSIEVFKNFMEYFSRLNIDTDKYAVVDIYLEVEETDTIPEDDRKYMYKIVRYSYDLTTDDNQKFLIKATDYVSLEKPTSLFEASYAAVHLYTEAVRKSNSFENEVVRKGSYGVSFQVGSGIITINDNNYVTAPFFVIRYSNDGSIYQTIYSKYDVQSASPWNWNIPSSYGYQCSFSSKSPEEGYKFKVPARKIALVAALSTSKNAEGYVDIYQMVTNEINDNGGIGGYTLKGDIFDTEGNAELCKTYIQPYIQENHPLAIFGAIDDECLNEIKNDIPEETELIFFRLLSVELNECDAPYFIGVKHASFYDKILDVIRNRFYKQIMIFIEIGIDDYNARYVEKYLKEKMITDIHTIEYNMTLSSSELSLRTTISRLAIMKDQTVCVLFFGYDESFTTLMDIIDDATNGDGVPFNVIIMENSQHMRKLPYYNYEYMEFYNPDDKSDINMDFKTKLYQRIDTDVYVSDVMIRTYSAIKLWQTALDSLPKNSKEEGVDVVDVERGNVRIALRNVQYNSPEGLVYFGVNQYLSRIPKILKFNENKTSTLIYDASYAIVPEAFEPVNGIFKKCDYSNDDIDDGNTVATYTILIMLSLSGDDKEIETPIFDSLVAAIGDINRNGLLLDNYINYTIIDTQSSDDIYESELKKLVNSTRYNYIFGGYKPSTLQRIGDILTGSDKIFFFLGRSLGDTCYSNVVSTHLHPSQITQAVLRRLLEVSTSAFIVRSNDEFASRISDLMTEKMKSLIITSNGNIIIDKSNTRRLINDIQRALPNGGYIITILTNDNDLLTFYDAICENGLTYPTYTILNSLFNENVIKEIDNNECLNGFMVFDSYFESVGNSEYNTVGVPTLASTCNTDIHIQIGDSHKVIGDYESAYSAITFWKGVIRKVNSFVLEDNTELYHYTVSIPADTVELNPNNYFNRRIYSGTFNTNGKIVVDWSPTQSFKPQIFNSLNESEIGLICDFYDKEKGKNYNTNPIILTFFHEKDLGGKTEKYNALLIDLIIKEINDVGGILGRQIAANHSWITISDAYRNARAIYEIGKSNTMFGCLTAECRTEISRYLKDKEPLFFFTGRDDGYECQTNLIVAGLSINQKTDVLVEYINTLGLKRLYVIGSDRNSSLTELHVIESAIQKSNLENSDDDNIEIVGHSFLSPFNTLYVQQILTDIESKLDKLNRIAIIDLYFATENTQFINGYIESSITSSTIIFFMKYDPLDLDDSVIKQLTGSYVVTSYSPTVSNTASGAFQYLMTAEYQDSIELGEILENTYSTIYTWKQAIEYSISNCGGCSWPNNDYIKLSLKYITYDSPSGPIKTESNNQISKDVFIFQLSDTSLIQVFPQQGIEYIVEGGLTYIDSDDNSCKFSKNTVYYELNEIFRWISISFSILNGFACLIVASVVYIYRHTRIIKSSSPLFLYYAIISLAILAVVGDMFTLLADNKIICAIRIWGLSLAINLLFSIMFSKAWRIHKLFNNKQLQKVKVSNLMLLKMIGLILAVQIVYLIIWQIVKPSEPTLSYSSGYSTYLDDVYMRECTSSIPFVYIYYYLFYFIRVIELIAVFLIFFWGAKLAWGVRNASAEFNESMSLMATIAIMIIMGVILVPLDYLMASETDTLMLLRSLGIELGVFFIILIQFAPKVMFLYTTEMSTTFTSGTFGSKSTNSNSMENRNRQLKAAAARGRFRIFPNVFYFGDLGLATISEPQHFFEETVGLGASCYSRRFDKTSSMSARHLAKESTSERTPLCSARQISKDE